MQFPGVQISEADRQEGRIIVLATPRPTRLPLTIEKFQNRSMHSCLCPSCTAELETATLFGATQGGAWILQYHHAVALERAQRLEESCDRFGWLSSPEASYAAQLCVQQHQLGPQRVTQGRQVAVM